MTWTGNVARMRRWVMCSLQKWPLRIPKHKWGDNTGQFKKKVTLSHVYNEITSEPTVTRYASIGRKALKVLICYLTNTQCGNPVSHGTRQSDSPFLSRLFPACPCLWLPQRRWCAVSILEDHLAGVVRRRRPWHTPRERSRTVWGLATWEAKCGNSGQWWQDTERLLLWNSHFATRSPLVVARNIFPRQLQTNFEIVPNNCCVSRDCRLTGYFITNMWKCYLVFELPCIISSLTKDCRWRSSETLPYCLVT
jgi:hypothetical protein